MKPYMLALLVLSCVTSMAGQQGNQPASDAVSREGPDGKQPEPAARTPDNIDCGDAGSEKAMMAVAKVAKPKNDKKKKAADKPGDKDQIGEEDDKGNPVANDRRTVEPHYARIIYDVRAGKLGWYDTTSKKSGTDGHIILQQNTLFPPVMYSTERILVTVCGAKFGADLSTSALATNIPEPNPIPNASPKAAPTPTLPTEQPFTADYLQSTPPTSKTKVPPAPADKAEAKKLETNAFHTYNDYKQLLAGVNRVLCSADGAGKHCTIDSVDAVLDETSTLQKEITVLSPDQKSHQGVFDVYSARTQKIVA